MFSSSNQSKILTIDETINTLTLKPMHWRIWILSAMGIWMEGFSLFLIGLILPLINLEYKITPLFYGILGSSVIIGAIIGSLLFGRLADIYGRKKVLLWNAIIVTIFSLLAGIITQNLLTLIFILIIIGIGVGADYPICASYIAELMPSKIRGKMLIGAFSFQAIGILTAALTVLLFLKIIPDNIYIWRFIICSGCIPALTICIFRITVPESPRWCIENNRPREAMRTILKLTTKNKSQIYKMIESEKQKITEKNKLILPLNEMFNKKYLKRTIFSCIPWFLMDIATYSIGIFIPIIILEMLSFNIKITNIINDNIFHSIICTIPTYIFLIIGFLINIFFVEKIGRIKLQLIGFLGMCFGLIIVACSIIIEHNIFYMIIGFITYNISMNMGPNATTFILPAELFPTKLRATAHGFSSSIAKIGAIIGIVMFPLLKIQIGLDYTILFIAFICLLGFIITLIFKVETTGKTLDELSHFEASRAMDHIIPKNK